MPIPDYQTIMLSLLKLVRDKKEHNLREVTKKLAQEFCLTQAEKRELLPSGKQARFDNRVGWARTYLKKAELLASTGRSRFQITKRGIEVLQSNPVTIDNQYLEQFPEYLQFKFSQPNNKQENDRQTNDQTPEETIESGYQVLRNQLIQDLLQRIKNCSPQFFERLVVDLLIAMGYGGSRQDAGQAIGQSGDGGVDGIIKEDPLGLDIIYLQAKRWQTTVGRPIIQTFSGSLAGFNANKG